MKWPDEELVVADGVEEHEGSCMRFCSPRRGRESQTDSERDRRGQGEKMQLGRRGRIGATWRLRGLLGPNGPRKVDRYTSTQHGASCAQGSELPTLPPRGRWQREDWEPAEAPWERLRTGRPTLPCRVRSHERVSLRLVRTCVCTRACVCVGIAGQEGVRSVLWPSGPHLSCWA